jgi:TolA-binding protein
MRRSPLPFFPCVLLLAAACAPATPQPVVEVDAARPGPVEVAQTPPPPKPVARPLSLSPGAAREVRSWLRAPRSAALAEAELHALTALLAQTPSGTNEQAALLRRVGDVGSEAAAAAEVSGAHAEAESARREAIRAYDKLAREHPRYCAPQPIGGAPGLDCGDAVYYALGLEAERAKELDTARKAYLRLIQSYPQSRLIPLAYVAFGDMFLREAEADPAKLSLSEQSYLEALKYPPPENVILGYAHLQLGRTLRRKGDEAAASRSLRKATAWAEQYPRAVAAAEIGAAAREEMAALRR